MIVRLAILMTLGALFLAAAASRVGAGEPTLDARCPAYTAHLRQARALMTRGHEMDALEELRRARQALDACIGEEAAKASPLADTGRRDPSC